MVNGLAQHFGTDRDTFAASLATLPSGTLVEPLARDFMALCNNGLVDANEGVTDHFHEAAVRLRMLNVVLLFSPQANDPEYLGKVYDTLYKLSGEQRTPVDEADVALYVQEFSKEVTSGKRIAKLNQRFGGRKAELLSRAAEQLLLGNAKAQLLAMEPAQLLQSRRAYKRALGAMVGSDIEYLHQQATSIENRMQTAGSAKSRERVEQIIEGSLLEWEVLPPGELEKKAREIVAAQNERAGRPITIDLRRLLTLNELRSWWGEGRSYFARGKLGLRRTIKRDGAEQPDQYILLVLQDFDTDGNLIGEHVIAESPIAGKHALYMYRYDVSTERHWREAMALPKDYARALGTRAVKHVLPKGSSDIVVVMTDKSKALLSCTKEDFPLLEFAGARGVRLPRQALPEAPSDKT